MERRVILEGTELAEEDGEAKEAIVLKDVFAGDESDTNHHHLTGCLKGSIQKRRNRERFVRSREKS